MRESVTTTVLTCDKCRRKVERLITVCQPDLRPMVFRSAMSDQVALCEICPDCWTDLVEWLGPVAENAYVNHRSNADCYRMVS